MTQGISVASTGFITILVLELTLLDTLSVVSLTALIFIAGGNTCHESTALTAATADVVVSLPEAHGIGQARSLTCGEFAGSDTNLLIRIEDTIDILIAASHIVDIFLLATHSTDRLTDRIGDAHKWIFLTTCLAEKATVGLTSLLCGVPHTAGPSELIVFMVVTVFSERIRYRTVIETLGSGPHTKRVDGAGIATGMLGTIVLAHGYIGVPAAELRCIT